jgi:hypothetical protein
MKHNLTLLVAALEGLSYRSVDQHKQIGIQRGSTPFYISTADIKQNINFKKSQELKGQTEKCKKKPVAVLS